MATYRIGTATSIDRLAVTGLSGEQARAIVEVISVSQESLASKSELRELEARLTTKLYSVGALVVGMVVLLRYLGL